MENAPDGVSTTRAITPVPSMCWKAVAALGECSNRNLLVSSLHACALLRKDFIPSGLSGRGSSNPILWHRPRVSASRLAAPPRTSFLSKRNSLLVQHFVQLQVVVVGYRRFCSFLCHHIPPNPNLDSLTKRKQRICGSS